VTHVIVIPGKKKRKTEPVCEGHAKHFEANGQMTTRLEESQREERRRNSRQWAVQRTWGPS
jgi:hypothetical protein